MLVWYSSTVSMMYKIEQVVLRAHSETMPWGPKGAIILAGPPGNVQAVPDNPSGSCKSKLQNCVNNQQYEYLKEYDAQWKT